MSDVNFANFTLTFYAVYKTFTFTTPTGWTGANDTNVQCYVGTSTSGTRVLIREKFIFENEKPISLYLRINNTDLGSVGKWTINDILQDYGTQEGNWLVNTYTFTPTADFNVDVEEVAIPAAINYVFTDAVNSSLANPLNYIPNGTPTAIDNITVSPNLGGGYSIGGDVTCNDINVPDGITYISGTITGRAIFTGSGGNSSTVSSAVFNDSYNNGTVTGNATFNGSSRNQSLVSGTATFKDYSTNGGTVGIGIFDGGTNSGTVSSTGLFINGGSNSGIVTGLATFEENGYNSTSLENAVFNSNSTNANTASITTASFNDTSVNHGTIITASFNDYSSNADGTITTANFYPLNTGTTETPVWNYPTNGGLIDSANCYWLEADNALGGSCVAINYLGYPV